MAALKLSARCIIPAEPRLEGAVRNCSVAAPLPCGAGDVVACATVVPNLAVSVPALITKLQHPGLFALHGPLRQPFQRRPEQQQMVLLPQRVV